ncbi:LacI family DNA-binding transcriptional regulator [Aestuariimicrobium soli]|uniref:LacI family DNA-binding transcriptional regulator n=1 Tax=Aestuariimicrobium soli TaxID=2035834 RepID=UPI003EBE61C9
MSSTRPTITDLARSLGLSKSAVSNALNGRPGVSEATRERVRAAAEGTGWRPNALARALSTGHAGAFGLCIARDSGVLGSESYYQRVIAGIEEVLIDSEHALLLRLVGGPGRDLDVYRRWAGERRVDGVCLFDLTADDPRPALVAELGLPAVIQGSLADSPHPVVTGDTDAEAALVVDHLVERGARRLVMLHGPSSFTHESERVQAVRVAADRGRLPLRLVETDYSQRAGHQHGRDLMAEGWADAVITSNDLLAVGVMSATQEGFSGPVASLDEPGSGPRVISWDDSLLCAYVRPGITALDRHPQAVGRQVARLLLAQVRGESVEPEPTPVTLVVRGSTDE